MTSHELFEQPAWRRHGSRLGALLTIAGITLITLALPARAQTGSECTGDTIIELNQVGVNQPGPLIDGISLSRSLAEPLVADDYLLNTYSYDTGTDRENDEAQASEIWFVEFLDADGDVVGTSGTTTDVADGVDFADVVDDQVVTLTGTATSLRIVHVWDQIDSGSVFPGCLGVALAPEPTTTTTTTTTTTVPPTTTTTTAPTTTTTSTTTTVPPTTTTTAPPTTTTTAAPTTTTTAAPVLTLPRTGTDGDRLAMIGFLTLAAGLGTTAMSRQFDTAPRHVDLSVSDRD